MPSKTAARCASPRRPFLRPFSKSLTRFLFNSYCRQNSAMLIPLWSRAARACSGVKGAGIVFICVCSCWCTDILEQKNTQVNILVIKKMYISDGVGDRLREERDRLGLNQTDFGAKGGVSRGTQKAYELGANSPDLRYLAALEGAGVDIQYVLSGSRALLSEQVLDETETTVIENFRALSESDKASVLRLTNALAGSPAV